MSGDIVHDLFTVFYNQNAAKCRFCLNRAIFSAVAAGRRPWPVAVEAEVSDLGYKFSCAAKSRLTQEHL
ncbi:MAG: hypothetical protein DMF17_07480 [Verrucomicrobia bacterium]|nr:MAG: hypothetical protein DMF17_07480 [Verrucomicrobiota bacterium]